MHLAIQEMKIMWLMLLLALWAVTATYGKLDYIPSLLT